MLCLSLTPPPSLTPTLTANLLALSQAQTLIRATSKTTWRSLPTTSSSAHSCSHWLSSSHALLMLLSHYHSHYCHFYYLHPYWLISFYWHLWFFWFFTFCWFHHPCWYHQSNLTCHLGHQSNRTHVDTISPTVVAWQLKLSLDQLAIMIVMGSVVDNFMKFWSKHQMQRNSLNLIFKTPSHQEQMILSSNMYEKIYLKVSLKEF